MEISIARIKSMLTVARKALKGDSNDAEHDALFNIEAELSNMVKRGADRTELATVDIKSAIAQAHQQAALRSGKAGEDMHAGIKFVEYFLEYPTKGSIQRGSTTNKKYAKPHKPEGTCEK